MTCFQYNDFAQKTKQKKKLKKTEMEDRVGRCARIIVEQGMLETVVGQLYPVGTARGT